MPRATNAELIARPQQTLANLERTLGQLTQPPDDATEAALERWLQLGIQICVDLGDRLIVARGLDEPTRIRDIFPALESLGVITREQSNAMIGLSNTRNSLVHDYGEFNAQTTPQEARRALPILKRVGQALVDALDV